MPINLTKLMTGLTNDIKVKDEVEIPKQLLSNTDIRDISKVKIDGYITSHDNNNFEVNLNIKCTLVLICSVSLKNVDFEIDVNISEIIGENSEILEENNKIINNTIDLIPIIWQNILLEVPLKVVSPDIINKNIYGDGWKFITEEEDKNEDIDPRLEKLKEYLSEEE